MPRRRPAQPAKPVAQKPKVPGKAINLKPGYNVARSGLVQTAQQLAGKNLAPRGPVTYEIGKRQYTDPYTVPEFYEQLGYDDPVTGWEQQAFAGPQVDPTQFPNYEKLSPIERNLMGMMSGWKNSPWGQAADKLGQAPALQWLGRGLEPLLGAFDIGAEALERGTGFVTQAAEAFSQGEAQWADFKNNMTSAWYAGSLSADMARTLSHSGDVDSVEDFIKGFRFDDDLPGNTGLIAARQRIADVVGQGGSYRDGLAIARQEYMDSLGALAFRAQIHDTAFHLLADPINILLPMVKPVQFVNNTKLKLANMADAEGISRLADNVATATRTLDEAKTAGRSAEEIATIEDALRTAENLQTTYRDARKLSWAEQTLTRVFGGEENFIKLTGGFATDVPTELKGLAKLTHPFQLTPQARSYEYLHSVLNNVLNYVVSPNLTKTGAIDFGSIARDVSRIEAGTLDPRIAHLIVTPEGRAVRTALEGMADVANGLATQRQIVAAVERPLFDLTAKALGATPYALMKRIEAGEIGPILQQLTQKLGAAPELSQELQTIAGRLGLPPQALLDANQFGSRMEVLKGTPLYDDQLLLLELSTRLGEATAKRAAVMFGLKERGMAQAFTDALKSAESLAYLRLNPTYPIRNKVNNVITMMARGAFGFMDEGNIASYWQKFGGEPPRLRSGFGPAEVAEKLAAGERINPLAQAATLGGQEIASVTKGTGVARRFEEWVGKLGDGLGKVGLDAGKSAANGEARSSALATTVGHIEGRRIFGKAGGGILGHARDVIRPEVAQSLGNNFIRELEHIASSARTPAELDALTSAPDLKLNFASLVERTEKQLGLGLDDVFGADFRLSVESGLQKAVDAGPQAVQDYLAQLYKQAETHISNLTDVQVRDLVQEVSAKVQAEGPKAWGDLYNKGMDTLRASESAHALRMAELTDSLRASPKSQTHGLWLHIKETENTRMERTWRRMDAIVEGIGDAAKQANIPSAPITEAFGDWRKTWKEFFSFRDKELNSFFEAHAKGETPRRTFQEIQTAINERYAAAVEREAAHMRKLDRSVSNFLPEGMPRDTFLAWRKRVGILRSEDKEMVRVFREETLPRIRGVEARHQAYNQLNSERKKMWTLAYQEEMAGRAALKGSPEAMAQYTDTIAQTRAELELGYVAFDKIQAGEKLSPDELSAWKSLVDNFADPDEIARLRALDAEGSGVLRSNRDSLFDEANQIGIATATEKGTPSYNRILNTLNKHRTPEVGPFTFDELRAGLTDQRLAEARYSLSLRDYDPEGIRRAGQLGIEQARGEAIGGTIANELTGAKQREIFVRSPDPGNPQAKMVWARQEGDRLIWQAGKKPKGAPFKWDGSPDKWHRVPGNEVDGWVEEVYESLSGGKGDKTPTEMWDEIQRAYSQANAPIPEIEVTPPKLTDFLDEAAGLTDAQRAEARLDIERDIFGRYVESTYPRVYGEEIAPTVSLPSLEDVGIKPEYYLSELADNTFNSHGQFALDALRDQTLKAMAEPALKYTDLTPLQQAEVRRYIEHAKNSLPDINSAALKFAEWKRDSALLNYNRRTNFDTWMGMFAPFAFWTTHSGWNWALHSIDRPAMLSTYFKMNKFLKEAYNPQPGAPSRFKGQLRIKLPFLPEWMGDQFIDPFQTALPFDNWSQPFENLENQEMKDVGAAQRKLDELLSDGQISQDEYEDGQQQSGPAWERALTLVQQDDKANRYDALDFAFAFANPHAPLLWAFNKMRGKSDPTGGSTFLPITRTISAATQALRIAPLTRPYIPPGGWNMEAGLRQALGLHPYLDQWQGYRIERELANMVADGEISVETAKRAMIDQTGEAYDRARDREGYERTLTTGFGFLGLPLRAYPSGEEHLRNLADDYSRAWARYDMGDTAALDEFNTQYPEYEARLGLFDTPDERIRKFLIDGLWDKWRSLPDLHKRELPDQLGVLFEQAFLNKDEVTGKHAYENISSETLATWLKLMGGDPPGSLQTTRNDVPPLQLAPPDIAETAQEFYDNRRTYFSNYRELQDGYYAIPETDKAGRKAFRNSNPELVAYWDWRREWLDTHPDVAPYLTDNSSTGNDTTTGGGGGRPYTYSKPANDYSNFRYYPTGEELRALIGDEAYGLLGDYAGGDPLPAVMQDRAESLSNQYGLSIEELAQIAGQP